MWDLEGKYMVITQGLQPLGSIVLLTYLVPVATLAFHFHFSPH